MAENRYNPDLEMLLTINVDNISEDEKVFYATSVRKSLNEEEKTEHAKIYNELWMSKKYNNTLDADVRACEKILEKRREERLEKNKSNFQSKDNEELMRLHAKNDMTEEEQITYTKLVYFSLNDEEKEKRIKLFNDAFASHSVNDTLTADVLACKQIVNERLLKENEINKAEKQDIVWADYKTVLTEGAVLLNAHSTEEFIKQAEQHKGKLLEGHFVNVDFEKVEEHFKDKFLPMPEIGRARVEYCDFSKCEDIKFPYDKAYLEYTSKTPETEMIKKQLKEMGADADINFYPPEGLNNLYGRFDVHATNKVNGEIINLISFSSSEMPKENNFQKKLISELEERVPKEEKELLDFVPEGTFENNIQKAMKNRCNFFYENVKTENKIMFDSKEDAVKFMKYMSKRAENYEKKNFRGLQKHWKHEAKEFAVLAEVMKTKDCTLERCIKMINHPSLQTQKFLKVQRDAWSANVTEDLAKSIDTAKSKIQELINEQKKRDDRFFGLGYFLERTVNKREYEKRQKEMTALRADYDGTEKVLKTYNAAADFDSQITKDFAQKKRDIDVTMKTASNEITFEQINRSKQKDKGINI